LFIYFCVVDGNETISDEDNNNGKGKVAHRLALSKRFLLLAGITRLGLEFQFWW
jgi:hypothetical protein